MAKLLWLDAGHGGYDGGAAANGLKEKDLNLILAKRVRDIIEDDYEGVEVKMTRTNDKFYELSDRADMANKAGADYFLSIHINAGGGTGYEDFIYNKLADGSSTDKKRDKIHEAVVPVLKKYGIKNRGTKKKNLAVLRETNMPAALVETLFIDDKEDANLLKDSEFLEDISQAYAKGVAAILGATKKKKPVVKPKPKPDGTIYRVQVGAFSKKENAEALEAKVRKEGYETIMLKDGNLYKVQIGAYSVKANAEKQKAKLKNDGFDAILTTL